jgi:hypothetical protein
VNEIRRNSMTDAERLCEAVFQPDCKEARIAMEAALFIVLCPFHRTRDQLQAMRTILEFTVPKPIADAVPLGVEGGRDFLLRLAAVRRGTDGRSC